MGRSEDKPYKGVSRNNSRYSRMLVGDEGASIKVMIFNDKIDEAIRPKEASLQENQIVMVKGTKFEDVIFADSIDIEDYKVYTKLSELKNA